ncbi:uncharacterized protein LOC111374443 isoform X2 [Olea europaea var. sylvestris]|uniref:uncharacterized protein LOC111374443 isoform X2 n=1 Tax=Olea europaea var. sylvestris TaxID=158386 RepID=UPI000C1CE19F|nr:uncharacterized protein LOC111374443 isoform X2 [Olea europaea var. sylvestris]
MVPTPRSNADVMTIDIRQALAQHIGLRDPHFLTFTTVDSQFLQSDYEDCTFARGTLACFHSVVIILMLLLLIRQTLMVTRDIGMVQASSDFIHYQISVLQLAGILISCYVAVRSWYIIQFRRRRQVC